MVNMYVLKKAHFKSTWLLKDIYNICHIHTFIYTLVEVYHQCWELGKIILGFSVQGHFRMLTAEDGNQDADRQIQVELFYSWSHGCP